MDIPGMPDYSNWPDVRLGSSNSYVLSPGFMQYVHVNQDNGNNTVQFFAMNRCPHVYCSPTIQTGLLYPTLRNGGMGL